MNLFKDDNSVLWRHVEAAVQSGIKQPLNKGNEIQFSCNMCSDTRKRGYMIWDRQRDVIYYKCFNYGDCAAAGEGNAWGAKRWLKSYFPHQIKSYNREVFGKHKGNSSTDNLSNTKAVLKSEIERKAALALKLEKVKEEAAAKLKEEAEAVKHFIPITSNNPLAQKAIQICKNRKIPEHIFKAFYVSLKGKYTNRLILPFFDNKGSIYYYQGRDLVGYTPKYLNRKTGRDSAIYNYYNVDSEKPVMVLEGPIDSMFVENGVAVLGLSISEIVKEKLEKLNCYFLFDDDKAGHQKSIEYLKEGKYVFNWRKFKKEKYIPDSIKDINDVYIHLDLNETMSFEYLKDYFTDYYYDQVYFK